MNKGNNLDMQGDFRDILHIKDIKDSFGDGICPQYTVRDTQLKKYEVKTYWTQAHHCYN